MNISELLLPDTDDARIMAEERLETYRRFLPEASKRFPEVFGDNIVPLALGIHNDLQVATTMDRDEISRFMWIHTHRLDYNHALATGQYRYDLVGRKCGYVSWVEAECGKSRIKEYGG